MRVLYVVAVSVALLHIAGAHIAGAQGESDEARAYIKISSPEPDAELDRNFVLSYHVHFRAHKSCTKIFVNGVHQPVVSSGIVRHEFCEDDVKLPLFFQPADYRIRVVLVNEDGAEAAEASLRFTVRMPSWAQHVVFHGTFDTLETVMAAMAAEQSGGYIRFGDDIVLADGKQDQMQRVDAALQQELQAVLASSGPGVFKTLMINADVFNGVEVDMVPGNHLVDDGFALRMVEIAAQHWRPLPVADIYSNAALSHAATSFPDFACDFLLALRAARPVAFVGNNNTSPALLRHLFGPQCAFVPAPPKNAYAAIGDLMGRLFLALHAAGVPTSEVPDPAHLGRPFTAAPEQCAGEAGRCGAAREGEGGAEEGEGEGEGGTGRGRFGVVVLALGPAGKAVQLRLLPVGRVFSVDFGSMLDALQGWSTRGGVRGEAAPAWIREGRFEREAFIERLCRAMAQEAAAAQRGDAQAECLLAMQ